METGRRTPDTPQASGAGSIPSRQPVRRSESAGGTLGSVRPVATLFFLVLFFAATACQLSATTVAEIGGQPVPLENFGAFVALHTGQPLDESSPELAAALFRVFLEEEVILAAAGGGVDRDLPAAVRSARARELLAFRCPPPPLPGLREAEEYLRDQGEEPAGGERLRLRQLILSDLPTARNVRQRLLRGESFEAISTALSRAPNAAEGGMLGWFERQQLPPEFEAAVFGLRSGQFSQPVASNAGWHVFHVMERENGTGAPSAAAIHRARAELAARLARQNEQQCLRELAAHMDVKVFCSKVSFPCTNPFEENS